MSHVFTPEYSSYVIRLTYAPTLCSSTPCLYECREKQRAPWIIAVIYLVGFRSENPWMHRDVMWWVAPYLGANYLDRYRFHRAHEALSEHFAETPVISLHAF